MTDLATRLQDVRTARSRVEIMSQCVGDPVRLPGRVSGSMAIKMVYQQANREQYVTRFRAVLDDLDQQERDLLAKLAIHEESL